MSAAVLAKVEKQENEDLQYFCDLIHDLAGIHLKPAKFDLVRTRLRARISEHGFSGFTEYRDLLASLDRRDPEFAIFTNLLTTNKTDFFREIKHFEYLVKEILPIWLKTDQTTFKVWSAAASSGEEPYTLAMVLKKYLPADKNFRILATDIDTEVLRTAENGVYSLAKLGEIPVDYHSSCLDIGQGNAQGWFRMKSHLKEGIAFKRHNLMDKTAPQENCFDLVLCRNVLIYFAQESIDFVQKKIHLSTKQGGHFFIGHSESLQGINHKWKSLGPSIFSKK